MRDLVDKARRLGSKDGRRAFIDPLYDPRTRGLILQAMLIIALGVLVYEIVTNTAANLRKQNIASGFGFLGNPAGFDISQTLVGYTSKSSYGAAFVVGLMNTIAVAIMGIMAATVLGFTLGIARLSPNPLVSGLALGYVEVVRNVPLLLQLLVWYGAVLRALPMPQESHALAGLGFLDVRGLHLVWPKFAHPSVFGLALLVAVAGLFVLMRRARAHKLATGEDLPVMRWSLLGALGLSALTLLLAGWPMLEVPTLGRFNFVGGLTIEPEFMALFIGLSVYTAAFIAENVRSGLQGVPRGQWEAGQALGLKRTELIRLVVLPQAMRIIIPPLTNQYLNLTKNSSLAVAIGYPDLVSVFSGTVLNQTGQAVEVIVITMGVYLTLSLITAVLMDRVNQRMALRER